jgi:hypothetical protein
MHQNGKMPPATSRSGSRRALLLLPLTSTVGQERTEEQSSKRNPEAARTSDFIKGGGSPLLHASLQPEKRRRGKEEPYTAPDLAAKTRSSASTTRHKARERQTAATTNTMYRKGPASPPSPSPAGKADGKGGEGSRKETDDSQEPAEERRQDYWSRSFLLGWSSCSTVLGSYVFSTPIGCCRNLSDTPSHPIHLLPS